MSLYFDPAALICELSQSLPDRQSFTAAAAAALACVSPLGEGNAYRALISVQRAHWTPPPDEGCHGAYPLTKKKLARAQTEPPIERDDARRRAGAVSE